MGTAENKEIVKAFYDFSNRGAIEDALGLFADDVAWTIIGSTSYSGTYAGKQRVVEGLLEPLFGQLKAGIAGTVRNLVAEGDQVVAEVTGEAETKDGRPYNNTYCFVFRIRDGKIREVREYMDTDLVRRVFGA